MDGFDYAVDKAKTNEVTWIIDYPIDDICLRCHNVFMYFFEKKKISIYCYFDYNRKDEYIKFLEKEFNIEIKDLING